MQRHKCGTVTLLGIGTVGSGVIQLLPRFLAADELHIVDRVDDLEQRVAAVVEGALPEMRDALRAIRIVTHTMVLTAEGLASQLSALFAASDAVMDLTTVVDSESVARLADMHGCVYINACLEVFAVDNNLSEWQRHDRFRRIQGQFRETMVLETGMNPGLISLLFSRALRDSGLSPDQVDTVHVTEYDTHRLRSDRARDDTFYNTWSPFGLFEEGSKKAEMAWRGPPPSGWVSEGHLIQHKSRSGCEITLTSVTPAWDDRQPDQWNFKPYRGFVVTHGETETISTRLGKEVKVAFVFRVCDDGRRGLARWGHNPAPKYEMMRGSDMDTTRVCADNIGTLVIAKGGKRAWWSGALTKCSEAQRIAGPDNNGANVTVAAACLATVAWALTHPRRGMLFPDDLTDEESELILRSCEPYLGEMVSCAVPPHLVPSLDQCFVETQLGVLPFVSQHEL